MAEPLTLQFAADVSRAQNAMASLAGSVVSNMTTMAAAMSNGSANTKTFGQTLDGLSQNAARAYAAVSADVRNISSETIKAASQDKATLEGVVRAFTLASATSNTAAATVRAGWATTTATTSTALQQIPSIGSLLRALLAFGAAAIVFETVAASVDLARKHVESFVAISKDAGRAGVGAEFFQRATLGAESYGLTVEQATQALNRFRDASEARIGEGKGARNTSPVSDRLEQNVLANNITAADKQSYENAEGTEAKFRKLLDIIQKLQEAGKTLAAYDLAGKFISPEFERQLRNGENAVAKLKATINSASITVAGIRIVGDEEVERARQLDEKAKEIANTFSSILAPINKDISNSALDTYQAFLDVEKTIARVVAIAAKLYIEISRIAEKAANMIPSQGELATNLGAPAIGKYLGIDGVGPKAKEVIDNFLRGVGVKPVMDAPEAYGPPAPPEPLKVPVRDKGAGKGGSNTLPSLTPRTGRSGSDSESLDAVETLVNQLEKARDTAKAELENVEKTNVEREKAVALAKAEAAAREDVKRGKRDDPALTDDERNRVLAAAEAMQKYRDNTKDAEQAIRQAADAAKYFGDITSTAFADAVLEGRSFNDILMSLEKQLARAALQGIFTGTGSLASLLGTAPTASSGDTVGGIAGMLKGGLGSFGGSSSPLQGPTMSGATLDTVAGGSGVLGLIGSFFGQFRANGGPVQAGMPYTVGEMGREMFIPSQNGRIVPIDNGFGGGGGGGTTNVGGDTINITPAGGVTLEQMAAYFNARDQRLQRDLPMITARSQSRFGAPRR